MTVARNGGRRRSRHGRHPKAGDLLALELALCLRQASVTGTVPVTVNTVTITSSITVTSAVRFPATEAVADVSRPHGKHRCKFYSGTAASRQLAQRHPTALSLSGTVAGGHGPPARYYRQPPRVTAHGEPEPQADLDLETGCRPQVDVTSVRRRVGVTVRLRHEDPGPGPAGRGPGLAVRP